jgi:hypothetical protein
MLTRILALTLAVLFTPTTRAAGVDGRLLPATELSLPRFHAGALEADSKEPEFLFDHEQALWVLGGSSLWVWRPLERKLSRMKLHDPRSDGTPLSALGTDGINLFASSKATVYQVTPTDGRIFRYPRIPATGKGAPRFVGRGDDFWWIPGDALLKLDRYGKKLAPRGDAGFLAKAGRLAYVAEQGALFWTEGKRLMRGRPDGKAAPKAVFSAKHPLLDVQAAGGHLIAHTAHTVLRLSHSGTVLQAIPVEGRRRLVRMHVGEDRHAYLFNDQLLEIYELATKTATRYALPLDEGEKIGRLTLAWPLAAVVADGAARVFRLGDDTPKTDSRPSDLEQE